jgi:serine/threonine-protein kinase RsbW
VALAVTEAVSNVVVHAYTESTGDNLVELEIRVEDAQLVIHVRDQGRGMVPRHDSPGLGYGLPLINRVADRVELSSVNGHGTEMCIRFTLPAG